MTTTDNQPTANAIAAALSTEELDALERAQSGRYINSATTPQSVLRLLSAKNLITFAPIKSNEYGLLTDYRSTDLGRAVLAAAATPQPEGQPPATAADSGADAGWYYSSVAQWIPEYSTEKINGYDGPFQTWQKALETLFKEIDTDIEADRKELTALRDQNAALRDQNARLQGLCARAANFVENNTRKIWTDAEGYRHSALPTEIVDDLRQAAGGEG